MDHNNLVLQTYSRFPFDELLVLFSLNGAPVILSIKFLAAECLASFLDFPAPMAIREDFIINKARRSEHVIRNTYRLYRHTKLYNEMLAHV